MYSHNLQQMLAVVVDRSAVENGYDSALRRESSIR